MEYDVVVNGEGQYSIWARSTAPPDGWERVGVHGSEEHCLDYIERVWTSIRPRSAIGDGAPAIRPDGA